MTGYQEIERPSHAFLHPNNKSLITLMSLMKLMEASVRDTVSWLNTPNPEREWFMFTVSATQVPRCTTSSVEAEEARKEVEMRK